MGDESKSAALRKLSKSIKRMNRHLKIKRNSSYVLLFYLNKRIQNLSAL